MKVSLIQMEVFEKNKVKNVENGLSLIKEYAPNSDVLVLPEVWTTGYSLGRLHQEADFIDGELVQKICKIASDNNTNIILGSIPIVGSDNRVSNTSLAIDRKGNISFEYAKIHLFGMFNEEKFFKKGENVGTYEIDGITCGTAICYDLRFPEYFRYLALKGAKIIFVPAEWPEERIDVWNLLVKARAVENQIFICAVNCSGYFKGKKFGGNSMLVSPSGEILAKASSLQEVLSVEINLSDIETIKENIDVLKDARMSLFNI